MRIRDQYIYAVRGGTYAFFVSIVTIVISIWSLLMSPTWASIFAFVVMRWRLLDTVTLPLIGAKDVCTRALATCKDYPCVEFWLVTEWNVNEP